VEVKFSENLLETLIKFFTFAPC